MKRLLCLLLVCALLGACLLPVFSFETDYLSYAVAVGDVCLPLPEYPVGSCCTTDGLPCVNHNHCISVYTTPDGETVDTMGWQCMGFARYVFYRCFGYADIYDAGVEGCYYPVVRNVSPSKVTVAYMQSMLGSSVLPGAHIRVGNNSTGHSMIYLGHTDEYVYTYEGNYDKHCTVTLNQRTWEEFVAYIRRKGLLTYIHMPVHYPQEVTWDCETDGHYWAKTEDEVADCTLGGLTHYTCCLCQAHKTEPLAPAEHHYIATELIPVSKDADGLLEYRCTVCTQSYQEPIACTGICPGNSTCPGASFADMPLPDNWAHLGIDWALEAELFAGTSATAFSPALPMTRAMLVTVLYRLDGAQQSEPAENSFTDVPADSWYTPAVLWAAQEGIVSGTGEGKFSPTLPVTREQIAAIFYRYAQTRGQDTDVIPEQTFPDADELADFAVEPVYWAVGKGLISGIPDSDGNACLRPKADASRAQVAAIFMRYVQAFSIGVFS